MRLVSLQKGAQQAEWEKWPRQNWPLDFGGELDAHGGAFMDTAAIIKHLDLVVSVDTAIGNLAGGLGAKVWVMLARSPDWRWGQAGTTTPWYPSMRLYRQREVNRWDEAFRQAGSELAKLAGR